MTNRAFACAVAGLIAVPLIAGCGSSSKSTTTTSTPASAASTTTTTTSSSMESRAETIKAKSSKLGTILADGEGKTVYLFEKDRGTTSMCSGACAQAWPPVTTSGVPIAGSGVTAAMLSTSKHSDGTMQVTYGGHPLYYFARDKDAGDAYGQGVSAFGAEWYVVGPNGKKVEGKSESAKSKTTTTTNSGVGGGY